MKSRVRGIHSRIQIAPHTPNNTTKRNKKQINILHKEQQVRRYRSRKYLSNQKVSHTIPAESSPQIHDFSFFVVVVLLLLLDFQFDVRIHLHYLLQRWTTKHQTIPTIPTTTPPYLRAHKLESLQHTSTLPLIFLPP